MWKIIRNLYLGDELDARNRFLLEQYRITHIVNCAREVRIVQRGFEQLRLELNDPDPGLVDVIDEVSRFIHQGRRRGGVLVHCRMGLSRSPAVILAYLCRRGKTLREAMDLLQRAVDEGDEFIEPHEVFLEQLRDYFDQSEDD